jgi:hypothetical protein
VLAVGSRSMMSVMRNCQAELEIVAGHIGLAAAHHMANSVTMFPWANIVWPQPMVLEENGMTLLDCQRDAAGGGAA